MMASRAQSAAVPQMAAERVDPVLLSLWFALLAIGAIMVMSASVSFAASTTGDAFYYLKKHLVFMLMGAVAALIALRTPLRFWYHMAPALLGVAFLLLVLVLVPGVGIERNGARRWLGAGGFTFQVAEAAKAGLILFLSAYLVRQRESLKADWFGLAKPFGVLGIFVVLLLLQPDFGSVVVMAGITVSLVFLAGIHLLRFLIVGAVGLGLLALLATSSAYRMQRITAFMDPWANQFDSGYQLTQSLIAFGRGEWFGVGLGNSLQKLHYLPEAHTDFIFAIVAEETGLLGSLLLILLFSALIARLFLTGFRAVAGGLEFAGYLVIGTATMFSIQAIINIGVACGLLPTKGLTLPFISAGGSSLLVCMALMGICLRVSLELGKPAGAVRAEVQA